MNGCKKYIWAGVIVSALSAACDEGGILNNEISGVSQKGPFLTGSPVTIWELNGQLKQTGFSFSDRIRNDKGEFTVNSVSLHHNYAFLKVDGYYRNEVTGKTSDNPITLNAYVDLSDRRHVNINLLTHLEIDRVTHLVNYEFKSFKEAKKQAQQEILSAFGFSDDFGASEDLNIFGNNNDAAMLLAASIIVQGQYSDHWESELTERLSLLTSDLADGSIDNQEIWQKMALEAMTQNTETIRQNIESWGEAVPDFEKYVRAFWHSKLGLDSCSTIGETQNYQDVELICTENGWEAQNTHNNVPPEANDVCGNGYWANDEECDDGNTADGDGCSSLCRLEDGFECPVPGSPCVESCSNDKCIAISECEETEPPVCVEDRVKKCQQGVYTMAVCESNHFCHEGECVPYPDEK